jgi:hypothetical protein
MIYLLKEDVSYFAGLFDGEGYVEFCQRFVHKKGKPRPYWYYYIRLEVNMADKDMIEWIYNTFKVGSVSKRKNYNTLSRKQQYRWVCSFQKAYHIAKEILPYSKVKRKKLQQIVDHYEKVRKSV